MIDQPRISVVVPVLNAARHLEPAAGSIIEAATALGDIEIIFVDNGSTDGSRQLLEEKFSDSARILQFCPGNVGAVRNHGVAAGSGEYLSFVDADCRIPRDYFSRALEVLSTTGADATGSEYELPTDPHWIEYTWFSLHRRPKDGPIRSLPAGNFFCKRAAFEAVGGFDEDLESGEDAELCLRLIEAGYRIFESNQVVAIHLGNPKTVSSFFRKQLWHSVGMLGTFRRDWRDLPLMATIVHSFLTLSAFLLFIIAGPSPGVFGCFFVLSFAVPFLSVAYRVLKARKAINPLSGLFLYWLYFGSRGFALAHLGLRRLSVLVPGNRS